MMPKNHQKTNAKSNVLIEAVHSRCWLVRSEQMVLLWVYQERLGG